MTLAGKIGTYLRARRSAGELSPASVTTMRYHLWSFAEHVGADTAFMLVREKDVLGWLEAQQHLSPATVRSRFSTVRSWFRYGLRVGWTRVDPTAALRGPRQPKSVPRTIERQVVETIVEAAPDARALLIVSLMRYEGLRAGEVAGLETGNVDRDARVLRVTGKGNRTREVVLSIGTLAALERYWMEFPPRGGPLVRSYTRPGRGVCAQYVSRLVSRWMRDAGAKERPYDGRSAHALRHHAADEMMEASGDVRLVAEFLGHASLSTTTIYLRRRQVLGPMRDAMDRRESSC